VTHNAVVTGKKLLAKMWSEAQQPTVFCPRWRPCYAL